MGEKLKLAGVNLYPIFVPQHLQNISIYVSLYPITEKSSLGAPGWPSQLSVQLLTAAQDMISGS